MFCILWCSYPPINLPFSSIWEEAVSLGGFDSDQAWDRSVSKGLEQNFANAAVTRLQEPELGSRASLDDLDVYFGIENLSVLYC